MSDFDDHLLEDDDSVLAESITSNGGGVDGDHLLNDGLDDTYSNDATSLAVSDSKSSTENLLKKGQSEEGNDKHNLTSTPEKSDDLSLDPELEAIKARVREMEVEAEKLKQMQTEVAMSEDKAKSVGSNGVGGGNTPSLGGFPTVSLEEKMEIDARSIYVGNVDYSSTAEELEQHFHGCGPVNRVTILCNKFDGTPKGFAYIEFSDSESVQTAVGLNDSLFKGRQIKVTAKRTNKPGVTYPRGGGRPPFYRGRGGGGYRGSGFIPGFRRPRYRGRPMYYSPY